MTAPRLTCSICGVVTLADDDTAVMLAEVVTFCAAHNTHDEGVGVEVLLPIDPDNGEQTA